MPLMNLPPPSPNTQSWWKLMSIGAFEETKAAPEQPSATTKQDEKETNSHQDMPNLMTDTSTSISTHPPPDVEYATTTTTLSSNEEEGPLPANNRTQKASKAPAQRQAKRLLDKKKKAKSHREKMSDVNCSSSEDFSTAKESSETFFDLLDKTVCNVDLEALRKPALQKMEDTAKGWGLLTRAAAEFTRQQRETSYLTMDDSSLSSASINVYEAHGRTHSTFSSSDMDSNLDRPTTTYESYTTYDTQQSKSNAAESTDDSSANDESALNVSRRMNYTQKKRPIVKNESVKNLVDAMESIEMEDVNWADTKGARVILPTTTKVSGNRSRSHDFSVEVSYNSSLSTIDEKPRAMSFSKNFLQQEESQSTFDEDEESSASDASSSVDYARIPGAVSNHKSAQILQGMSTLTEDSAATSLASSQQSSFGDEEDGISRSCLSPPKIRKGIRSVQGAKTGSTSVMSSDAASTTSGLVYDSSSADDQSYLSRQCDSNSHHAYAAFFERGDEPMQKLRLFQHPTPDVFPTSGNEIVVKVEYSTISETDCAIRKGLFWGKNSDSSLQMPIVPGVSFSGTIVQISRANTRSGFRNGDRVTSLVRVGANSRHLCISRDRVVKIPPDAKKINMIACLPEVVLGSFQALHMNQRNAVRYRENSLSGKNVFIVDGVSAHGASLIQLAHAAGANNVYAAAKEKHFGSIEAMKATPVDRDPKFWFSLLKGRVDLVIGHVHDAVSASYVREKHVDVLSRKGMLVILGPPEHEQKIDLSFELSRKVKHVNIFDSWEEDTKQAKRDLAHLIKLVESGSIQPRIFDSVPLNKVGRAQEQLERQKMNGFLLCDPWIPIKQKQPVNTGRSKTAPITSSEEDAVFDLD